MKTRENSRFRLIKNLKEKNRLAKREGITLVALVVTVVVLLILAGVSISTVLGENGLITQARKAAKDTNAAQEAELQAIDNLEISFAESTGTFVNSVNKPNLKTGMTPINFTVNSSKGIYEATKTSSENTDNSWYNYITGKWANAQTEDGSMWVWIPRFAYKVNNETQTFDVKFLIGTTDYYYETVDGEQIARKAERGTATLSPDTTTAYTVHPAFTNERSIGYANGGWDSELTGIWVAKFEAGYATSNGNTTPNLKSSVKYNYSIVYASSAEGEENGGSITARNWLDGEYGGITTNISYPTFQGAAYSMNYVAHGEAFALCSVLTENGNVYGLKDDTDSHLMKNSEWGAVAYLAQSQYGLAGDNIYINNVSMNSGAAEGEKAATDNPYLGVYAITGVESSVSANGNTSGTSYTIISDIAQVNNRSQRETSNIRIWSDTDGGKSSTTGDVYGVFDMSGGLWERTADYIANNKSTGWGNSYNSYTNATDAKYKRDFTYTSAGTIRTTSSKYATVWSYDTSSDEASANYKLGKGLANRIYGSAVFETSTLESVNNSWCSDYSIFLEKNHPFFIRGGGWHNGGTAGLFAFDRHNGSSHYNGRFPRGVSVEA